MITLNGYDAWKTAAPEVETIDAPHEDEINAIAEWVEAAAKELGFSQKHLDKVWEKLVDMLCEIDIENAQANGPELEENDDSI